ncbi:MAG TPA: cysteine desulfurase family protein [Candidatus Tumulicola sp.]|nr:cysteine desulfurase family protein [Candidatus Tumulicola sp.]
MIYLDYAATTPCRQEVLEAMLPYFATDFGNAASIDHAMGSRARKAVERAREQVALLVGAAPEEVIFTSGSTESNNLVLNNELPVITSAIEHPSILDPVLKSRGELPSRILPVSSEGVLGEGDLERALEEAARPLLVTIMFVNNELGTVQEIRRLGSLTHRCGSFFHSDITQAMLTQEVSMKTDDVDAVSLSAHKIYGPKGVGALVSRSGLRRIIRPRQFGGGHERGLRSGTLNVPGIVGFGEAARLVRGERDSNRSHVVGVRTAFTTALKRAFEGELVINGSVDVSPHICSIQLKGVNNRALLQATAKELCFSLGSACATNKSEPSHVLLAIGKTKAEANETIRISFGLNSQAEESTLAAVLIADKANSLLSLAA